MAVNETITQTTFTGFSRFPKFVHIQELKTALTQLDAYSKNVVNCNCAPSNCCQANCSYTCQSCQSCQWCQTCQSQCQNCWNCNCGDDGS